MKKEKRDYVAPDTEVKHVEIESAICASSGDQVDFNEEPVAKITEQEVATVENNDFSAQEWNY